MFVYIDMIMLFFQRLDGGTRGLTETFVTVTSAKANETRMRSRIVRFCCIFMLSSFFWQGVNPFQIISNVLGSSCS